MLARCRVPLLVTVIAFGIAGCKPSSTPASGPAAGEAPTVRGVSTGMTLPQAVKLLGPGDGRQTAVTDLPAMTRVVSLGDAVAFVEVGRVKTVHGFRLDHGPKSVEVGASEKEVEALLGKPTNRFTRAGEPFWQYKFGKRRIEPVFAAGKLARVEITEEPARFQQRAPPHGVGTRGDLRIETRLSLDHIELGMRTQNLDVLLFTGERVSPTVKQFGETTFAGFEDGDKVAWVLGTELRRDGEPWVRAGMTAKEVQAALATVGQLRTNGTSAVAYSFRQFGDVRMRLEDDGTVSALELTSPSG